MSDLSPREKRLQLLEAISARLENMGVPASSTAPSGKKIKRTFANLCRQIEDQSLRAELQQIDFRAGFEINETTISIKAGYLAQLWYELDCQLPKGELLWTERRPSRGNWNPRRWFKKILLKRERQIADYFFKVLQETGKFDTPIICNAVLQSKQRQNDGADKFAAEHQLTAEIGGELFNVPFSKAASTAQKRSAKLYVRALGLEKYCTKSGLKGFFVTLTLPGSFHPNPSAGKNSWGGATPEEGHDELHRKWRLVQREVNRIFGKLMGIRVEEPHEDGCPHWHLLIYIPPRHESSLRKIISRYFGNDTAAKVEAIDHAKGRGASYIMKYIIPAMNASGNTVAARYQAHRATWGKRAIQIFDYPGSSTLWDQMRRIKPGSAEYRTLSNYARCLHTAACCNDYCAFLSALSKNKVQLESGLTQGQPLKKSRRVSILYSEREVFACSSSKDTTTTTFKKIQGVVDNGNSINTHPHDWKIERKPAENSPTFSKKRITVDAEGPRVSQDIATVTHSYPRNTGLPRRCSRPGSEPPKINRGFEDWHAVAPESVAVIGGVQSSQAKGSAPSRRLRLPGRGERSDQLGSTAAGSLGGPAEIADG